MSASPSSSAATYCRHMPRLMVCRGRACSAQPQVFWHCQVHLKPFANP